MALKFNEYHKIVVYDNDINDDAYLSLPIFDINDYYHYNANDDLNATDIYIFQVSFGKYFGEISINTILQEFNFNIVDIFITGDIIFKGSRKEIIRFVYAGYYICNNVKIKWYKNKEAKFYLI